MLPSSITTVTCLRVDVYTTLDQSDRAVAACLDYLRHVGIDWSPHPTEEQGRREYQQIWSQLGSRAIEALVDLPLMSDPAYLATVDVLTKMSPPALYTDANLLCLAICRAVNLSLERGNGDGSCVAYVMLGMIAGLRFGNYEAGFRFGRRRPGHIGSIGVGLGRRVYSSVLGRHRRRGRSSSDGRGAHRGGSDRSVGGGAVGNRHRFRARRG